MTTDPSAFKSPVDEQIAELFRYHMVGPGEILLRGSILDLEAKMDTPSRDAFRAGLARWADAGFIEVPRDGVYVRLTQAGYDRAHQ